jgi:hypothetical protein
MKYFISFILSIIILTSSITSAFAAEDITFKLQDTQCKNNRLFTVNMIAKSEKPLSAATFEFVYDKEMFEYRSIKASDNESQVSANCKNGSIKAVFLNTYGQNIENDTVILSITFKAINEGTGYIDFNVKECVDSDVEWLDIGKCTSSKITVTPSKSNKISNSSSKNTTKKNKSDSKKDISKSERVTEPVTTIPSTIYEYGPLNDDIENSNKLLLGIGFMFGCGLIILIILIIMILKKIVAKNNKAPN